MFTISLLCKDQLLLTEKIKLDQTIFLNSRLWLSLILYKSVRFYIPTNPLYGMRYMYLHTNACTISLWMSNGKRRGEKKLELNFIINIRVQFSESHIHVFIRSHNFTNLVLGANSILKLKLVKKNLQKSFTFLENDIHYQYTVHKHTSIFFPLLM